MLEKVLIITTDGRTLTGTLESFDQQTNVILSETIEIIIATVSVSYSGG